MTTWIQVSPDTEGGSLPAYIIEAGGLLRQTLQFLQSDLLHDDGTLAVVYGDSTTANNGNYIKSGPSGSGAWVFQSPLGGGTGSGSTLGSRTVDVNSPLPDQSASAADAGGVVFLDGGPGAFDFIFDPDTLPGMGIRFVRIDSSPSVANINIKGEGLVTKGTLSAPDSWTDFKSLILTNGSTQLKQIASGTIT